MSQSILILGTGLIGASAGLALRRADFRGEIAGYDRNSAESAEALRCGAITRALSTEDEVFAAAAEADTILLATPVLAILDWLGRLAPVLKPHQLVTDAGSTKGAICALAAPLYNGPGQPRFLPGHPMAGKELGGAALADGALFHGAMWLFTPQAETTAPEGRWREHVAGFGARTLDLQPGEHDRVCAWVSHLPQMVSTAISALCADAFRAWARAPTACGATSP